MQRQRRHFRPEPLVEFFAPGNNHAAIEGIDVLVQPEAVNANVPDGPDQLPPGPGAKGLRGIFDERDILFAAGFGKVLKVHRQPMQMGHQHRAGVLVQQRFDRLGVDVASGTLNIGKNRNTAGANDHVDHVIDGVRGKNDFLAGGNQAADGHEDAHARLGHAQGKGGAGDGLDGGFKAGQVVAPPRASKQGLGGNPAISCGCGIGPKPGIRSHKFLIRQLSRAHPASKQANSLAESSAVNQGCFEPAAAPAGPGGNWTTYQ